MPTEEVVIELLRTERGFIRHDSAAQKDTQKQPLTPSWTVIRLS